LPRVDLRRYWSDLALGWLWASVYRGHFGPVEAIYSRRAMRAADTAAADRRVDDELVSESLRAKLADTRFAIDAGDGRERYPGVALVVPQGRLTLEWVMTPPSQQWIDEVLDGYAAKPQVGAAVLIASSTALRDQLRARIQRRGLGDRVRAQHGKFLRASQ
jgi:hypothetical protein